jgi:hypothetical protein
MILYDGHKGSTENQMCTYIIRSHRPDVTDEGGERREEGRRGGGSLSYDDEMCRGLSGKRDDNEACVKETADAHHSSTRSTLDDITSDQAGQKHCHSVHGNGACDGWKIYSPCCHGQWTCRPATQHTRARARTHTLNF